MLRHRSPAGLSAGPQACRARGPVDEREWGVRAIDRQRLGSARASYRRRAGFAHAHRKLAERPQPPLAEYPTGGLDERVEDTPDVTALVDDRTE